MQTVEAEGGGGNWRLFLKEGRGRGRGRGRRAPLNKRTLSLGAIPTTPASALPTGQSPHQSWNDFGRSKSYVLEPKLVSKFLPYVPTFFFSFPREWR